MRVAFVHKRPEGQKELKQAPKMRECANRSTCKQKRPAVDLQIVGKEIVCTMRGFARLQTASRQSWTTSRTHYQPQRSCRSHSYTTIGSTNLLRSAGTLAFPLSSPARQL